jgi:hypothetical protein
LSFCWWWSLLVFCYCCCCCCCCAVHDGRQTTTIPKYKHTVHALYTIAKVEVCVCVYMCSKLLLFLSIVDWWDCIIFLCDFPEAEFLMMMNRGNMFRVLGLGFYGHWRQQKEIWQNHKWRGVWVYRD